MRDVVDLTTDDDYPPSSPAYSPSSPATDPRTAAANAAAAGLFYAMDPRNSKKPTSTPTSTPTDPRTDLSGYTLHQTTPTIDDDVDKNWMISYEI